MKLSDEQAKVLGEFKARGDGKYVGYTSERVRAELIELGLVAKYDGEFVITMAGRAALTPHEG